MQATPLTFNAVDQQGNPFTIIVEQTDNDAANLTITQGGASPATNTYQVSGIRRVGEGEFTGNVSGGPFSFFMHPTVKVSVLPNSFNVTVGNVIWPPKPIQLIDAASTSAAVNAWVDGAAFPPA